MKIAFTGTASTGKTTLINELLKYKSFKKYHLEFITTDARAILQSLGFKQMDLMSKNDKKLFQQIYLSKKIKLETNYSNFITDRSFIDVASYWLVRDCNKNYRKAKEVLEKCKEFSMNYDFHFFFPHDLIPFESDGYRSENEEQRIDISDQILQFLQSWDINFKTIKSPNLNSRIKFVIKHLNILWNH